MCAFSCSHCNTDQIHHFILKECQSSMCPGIPNTCQVGFLPVVSVPSGKCCPELKCGEFMFCCLDHQKQNEVNSFLTSLTLPALPLEPKRVCVYGDIEYQVKTNKENFKFKLTSAFSDMPTFTLRVLSWYCSKTFSLKYVFFFLLAWLNSSNESMPRLYLLK